MPKYLWYNISKKDMKCIDQSAMLHSTHSAELASAALIVRKDAAEFHGKCIRDARACLPAAQFV